MSNKTYDVLKDIALCWMPYGIVFIGVVLTACKVPYAEVIMTILAAANAFLGKVVDYYKKRYDKAQEVEDGSN
jgi:hypothetical protein